MLLQNVPQQRINVNDNSQRVNTNPSFKMAFIQPKTAAAKIAMLDDVFLFSKPQKGLYRKFCVFLQKIGFKQFVSRNKNRKVDIEYIPQSSFGNSTFFVNGNGPRIDVKVPGQQGIYALDIMNAKMKEYNTIMKDKNSGVIKKTVTFMKQLALIPRTLIKLWTPKGMMPTSLIKAEKEAIAIEKQMKLDDKNLKMLEKM